LVMGKLDTEGNELDRAKRLIRILEELVNSEFVPEGNELEIVELLIRILKELLARVLDAKEREIEAEARLNEEEDGAAAEAGIARRRFRPVGLAARRFAGGWKAERRQSLDRCCCHPDSSSAAWRRWEIWVRGRSRRRKR